MSQLLHQDHSHKNNHVSKRENEEEKEEDEEEVFTCDLLTAAAGALAPCGNCCLINNGPSV